MISCSPSMNAMARSMTARRRPAALEACAALGGALRQCAGLPFALEALERRRAALRLRRRRSRAHRRVSQHLRSYGGGAGAAAAAGTRRPRCGSDEAHVEREPRALSPQIRHRRDRCSAGRFGFYRPPGGFFLWLDVGDGEQAALRAVARGGDPHAARRLYRARRRGGDNPGERYIRVALVHDDATIAAGHAAACGACCDRREVQR